MVQQQLRIATFRARGLKDIAAAASASFALVLLSKGVLEDPDFALRVGQMRAPAEEIAVGCGMPSLFLAKTVGLLLGFRQGYEFFRLLFRGLQLLSP